MSSSVADKRKCYLQTFYRILATNGYTGGSLDFETTNNFFQQITEHSKQKLNELNS